MQSDFVPCFFFVPQGAPRWRRMAQCRSICLEHSAVVVLSEYLDPWRSQSPVQAEAARRKFFNKGRRRGGVEQQPHGPNSSASSEGLSSGWSWSKVQRFGSLSGPAQEACAVAEAAAGDQIAANLDNQLGAKLLPLARALGRPEARTAGAAPVKPGGSIMASSFPVSAGRSRVGGRRADEAQGPGHEGRNATWRIGFGAQKKPPKGGCL